MKHAFISGILAAGAESYDADVIPTPTLAFATRNFKAGAMITASHNPPEYNGIKLFNPDGSSFEPAQQEQIEKSIFNNSVITAPWHEIRKNHAYCDPIEQHIQRIKQDFTTGLKIKVVLDCGCGAGSVVTPRLLTELGCEVISLNCYPTGFFPRHGEPTEPNLSDLAIATKELAADLGIAHDGDADRMMAVDDKGRFIPGDKLMGILARSLKAKRIITTVDASMTIEEMGFSVKRSRVGDSHVSTALKKDGDFGGEPSGCWIFPSVSLCPDGIYAAAYLASVASQQKLSELMDDMPSYHILRGNLECTGIVMTDLKSRLAILEPKSISNTDGIRLTFEDGWMLVRPSGTEPKLRLSVETTNKAKTLQLYDKGVKIIKELSG
jgi:phosphoglucosamine mutase